MEAVKDPRLLEGRGASGMLVVVLDEPIRAWGDRGFIARAVHDEARLPVPPRVGEQSCDGASSTACGEGVALRPSGGIALVLAMLSLAACAAHIDAAAFVPAALPRASRRPRPMATSFHSARCSLSAGPMSR